MKKTYKKAVFLGSGPVAARSLELLSAEFEIEAVITKPRPPHHRGDMPVPDTSASLGFPIFTASDNAELEKLFTENKFESPVGILVDFGIIVSQKVIESFPLGIVNSHFSLLPQWRGADPITFAILSGQKQTGVSLMLVVEAMDEGPLLAQSAYDLPGDITTPELTADLVELSHSMLSEIVPLYLDGKIHPVPQDEANVAGTREPSYSRKLDKQDGVIDWNKPAAQLEREIRAFIEWPKSRTKLAGKDVIITKASILPLEGDVGQAVVKDKKIVVFCATGALQIEKLKPSGKREMTAEAFLAGYGKNCRNGFVPFCRF